MLKPEALLQLFLPRAILSLYNRGNHTSIYNTRHAFTHTSDGETERERERERTGSERETVWKSSDYPTPAVFKVYDRKTAQKKQSPSENTMV